MRYLIVLVPSILFVLFRMFASGMLGFGIMTNDEQEAHDRAYRGE